MCGVVGIVDSTGQVLKKIFHVLTRLEYRGYDAAGLSLLVDGELVTEKIAGSVQDLEHLCDSHGIASLTPQGTNGVFIGIGHTRWATHGVNSNQNAHPIIVDDISLVHNGTIENHLEIRKMLEKDGFVFQTDTDTEVIAALIHINYRKYNDMLDAIVESVKMLEGIFNCLFLSKRHPGAIYAIQNGVPLVVGSGDGGLYLSSDSVCIASYANRVSYIEDNGIVVLSSDNNQKSGHILSHKMLTLDKVDKEISFCYVDDKEVFSKNGYSTYMMKEIREQRSVVENLWLQYCHANGFKKEVSFLHNKADIFSSNILLSFDSFCIVGCGSALHAAMVGKYLIESMVQKRVEVEVASEFNSKVPILNKNTLYIFVSQSGETADTFIALQYVKQRSMVTMGIVNVENSRIGRNVDYLFGINAGHEISIASTKCFTAQLMAFLILSLKISDLMGLDSANGSDIKGGARENTRHADIDEKDYKYVTSFSDVTSQIRSLEKMMSLNEDVLKIAKEIYTKKKIMYVARGLLYPLALEGALKMKELAYIPSEGYASGELKHGSISLVDGDTPIIIIAQRDHVLKKLLLCLEEVHARNGKIYLISHKGIIDDFADICSGTIEIPEITPALMPLFSAVPLQFLAYHVASLLGRDVDRPRNLAKSVTVE